MNIHLIMTSHTSSRWQYSKKLISGTPSSPSEVSIAYIFSPSTGKDDPETILLLHGYPESSYQFRHVITALSDKGFDVVAPDYRGAGRSSKPLSGYDKVTMAADIHELVMKHLGIKKKVHVVGHDIGGMIAYAYASRYPNATASVAWGTFN